MSTSDAVATQDVREQTVPPTHRRFTGVLPRRLLRPRRPLWWQEIAIIAVGYWLYTQGRNAIPNEPAVAIRHGLDIQHLQQRLHLSFELAFNHAVAAQEWLAQIMDYYYATLHFVVTPAVMIWLFLRRSDVYRGARTVLVTTTLLGLLGFYLFPTAPAPAAATRRLHRHGDQVPHVGFVRGPEHRRALQPVRRDAEPAHRLGAVVRHRSVPVRAAPVGARARRRLPRRDARRHPRHGQPLPAGRGRWVAILAIAFALQYVLSGHGAYTPPAPIPVCR